MSANWVESSETKTFPYADWEAATRPAYLKDIWKIQLAGGLLNGIVFPVEFPSWRPIYVRVRGGNADKVRRNALQICQDSVKKYAVGNLILRLADDGRLALETLIATKGKIPVHLRYFFLYISEPYGTISRKTFSEFKVIQVGPAVPGLSLWDTLVKENGSAVACGTNAPPAMGQVDLSTVVTGIIDTEIGIANERFCYHTGDRTLSRVHHFWRQQRESIAGIPGLGIGREFTKANIDHLLFEAKGDERLFYTQLRSGQFGQSGFIPEVNLAILPGDFTLAELFGGRWTAYVRSLDDLRSDAERTAVTAVLRNATPGDISGLRAGPYTAETDSRPVGFRIGHGTAIADIAAGFPIEQGNTKRPIVAVELPDYVIADTAGARLEVFALMAVRRILNWVDRWGTDTTKRRVPVVINISLGASAGPRNGAGFLESQIARLVNARSRAGIPTKVVFAAGNSYRERLSGSFELKARSKTIEWILPPGDKSPSFLEIRLPIKSTETTIKITVPGVASLTIDPKKNYELLKDGVKIGRIYNEKEGKLRCLTLALAATSPLDTPQQAAPSGTYVLTFRNKSTTSAKVNVNVQRDDSLDGWPSYGRQSYLDHPAAHQRDPETGVLDFPDTISPVQRTNTLSAYVTNPNRNMFSVGGAYAASGGTSPEPTLYTSSGPSNGMVKTPDMAAVTEEGRATPGRLAAGYLSGSTAIISGTSCAAPQLTRALVELMIAKPGSVSKAAIRKSVLPHPVTTKPDLRLGYGVIAIKTAPGRLKRRLAY